VVAVTGLAGHAYGSWRNSKTGRMWLEECLPRDISNVRIMTYGYNTKLVGAGLDGSRLIDHRRSFIEQLNIARSEDKVGWRNPRSIDIWH